MKSCLLTILACLPLVVFGQLNLNPDTLTIANRTGGAIDTCDISNADLPTTFDGGISILSPQGFSSERLFQDLSARTFQRFTEVEPIQFAAIPHLGFAYSFGGQAQFTRLRYEQAFSKHLLLNFKYDRNNGVGILRNSTFARDNVRMRMQYYGKRYSFQLTGSYQVNDVVHSGGIATDTLIEPFGLIFTPVLKDQASSKSKLGTAKLKNYFNFTDSLLQFGLVTNHDYSIVNRLYSEVDSDSLDKIYPAIYIDTLETRDQFQLAKINNAAGVYFSDANSQFYLDGMLEHSYWRFQNLGENIDTTEINLKGNLRVKLKDFVLKDELIFNLIGGFNQWSNKASMAYSRKKFEAKAYLAMENLAPDPLLRNYHGNVYDYELSSISNQLWTRVGGDVGFKHEKFNVAAFGSYSNLSGTYLFDGTSWRNDSLNDFNFVSIGVKGHTSFGVLNVIPQVIYSIDDKGYLPNLQSYLRVYVKGRLFKAKKLEALLGVDGSYQSAFNNRLYNPSMDTYDWYSSPVNTKAMFNAHAFVTMGMDQFRFYFRFENIGYFWNDRTILESVGYPIAGTRLRMGVTWDFFN